MADVFKVTSTKLRMLEEQKIVAADNITRSSLPGAKTKTINFKGVLHSGQEAPNDPHTLKKTNDKHLGSNSGYYTTTVGPHHVQAQVSLSNNSIDAHEQMAKFDQAATDYYKTLNILQTNLNRYKMILSSGK
ncbi:flagellar basal body rod protein FlgB [Candidatus Nucleicultrix amoebiphila]|jgi:flagellar basal-body rod protein FlgB|uniref:Flagellar basal body rod protein FlgB n=1 Tax=Candidatus Nucleicultrix amoebiphila FS5 TaxID=1414854 RepID=A0A1W6N3K3_9PROT|nr:hypothetical protein [Candidatus Nucleicultrix amoebiphila]ARN84403.1 hypothetical protein GQ61_02645 [Candidatus Nucleicultrix amoebiphila FS5]